MSIGQLHVLGERMRDTEGDGEIVGEEIAGDGEGSGEGDAAFGEEGDVHGTAADIHEEHAEFLFFFGEHGVGGREGLGDQFRHGEIRAGDALHDVFDHIAGGGDDVGIHGEAAGGEADGIADAGLAIHPEAAGNGVDHLVVGRDGDGGDGGGHDGLDFFPTDLAGTPREGGVRRGR